jgi:hypothetical protein
VLSGLYGITYGGGLYVAVGNNTIITSPDGIEWTPRAPPSETASLRAVTYEDGLYLAVGSNRTVISSPDGVEWTRESSVSSSSSHFTSVAYGNGLFVTASGDYDYWTSPDGHNWTTRAVTGSGGAGLYGVTFGGGRFMSIFPKLNNQSAIGRSDDGVVWSWDLCPVAGARSVTYGDGEWMVVGSQGEIYSSVHGEEWTERVPRTDYPDDLYKIIRTSIGYIIVGNTGGGYPVIVHSEDGVDWTEWTDIDVCDRAILHSVVEGPNAIVAVGTGGCVLVHEL